MKDEIDKAKITKAVRGYNAARNSLGRAYQELLDAIPDGFVVLHKIHGMDTCWSHWKKGSKISNGIDREDGIGSPCVVIEAPNPLEEFLPRLAD